MGVFQYLGVSPMGPSPPWLLEQPLSLSLCSMSQGLVPWPPPPSPSYRLVAHQGDEVCEGELQADVDHVRIMLGGPQVGVVVAHQVCQQTLFLVPALGSCNRQP